jgi:hypothetical protein
LLAIAAQAFENGAPRRIAQRLEQNVSSGLHKTHNPMAIDQVDP